MIKKFLYITLIVFIGALTILTIVFIINEFAKSNYSGLNEPRTITVTGEETLYVKPDQAKIIFSVVSQDTDYQSAVEINNDAMQAVIDNLKEMEIDEKDLRTLNFTVSPQYEYVEKTDRSYRELVGYEVNNNLRVLVRNLSFIDQVIANSLETGANEVSGLTFVLSNEEELKSQAREKAIVNAKSEAQKIASALGVNLGRIIDFSETHNYYFDRLESAKTMEDSGAQVPIEAGENEISSTVRIQFEIR